MRSRKPFLTPIAGLILFGLIAAGLVSLLFYLPQLFPGFKSSLERHLFLESVTALIGLGLLLAYVRNYRRTPSNNTLLFVLGLTSFFILQNIQILALLRLPNFFGLTDFLSLAAGLDLSARLLLSLHVLFALFFVFNIFKNSSTGNKTLISFVSLFFLILTSIFLLSPFRPQFVFNSAQTDLSIILEICTAGFWLLSAILMSKQFFGTGKVAHAWFLVTLVLAIFVSISFTLSTSQYQIYDEGAHFLKIIMLTVFAFSFVLLKKRSQSGLVKAQDFESKMANNLIERIPTGIAIFDLEQKLTFCNQAFEYLVQYPKTEILEMKSSDFFEKQASESDAPFETELITKDNAKIPVLVNQWTLNDEVGARVGSQYHITDLRPQKEARERLQRTVQEKKEEANLFQQCIEHSTEGLLITDLSGRISYVNKAFTRMTGYEKSELIGLDTSTFIGDKRGEVVHEVIWAAVKEGRVWRGEFYTRKKDGGTLVGELSVVPVKEKDGKISMYLWIERDITRRNALEKSLHKYTEELTEKTNELENSRAYYQTLISGMTDILIVVDNDNQCTFINEYGKKRLNYEADELTKQKLPIFFDDLKRLEKDYGSKINIEIKDFEGVIKTKSGDSVLCSWNARPLFAHGDRRIGAMAVGRDITEYKKLQLELQEHAKNLENKVATRTADLQTKVNQLAKLLEIGEEIRLNTDIDVILNKICEAVVNLGWKRAVITLRNMDKQSSRPVAVAGLEPKEIEKVMSWREIPFEHTERYFKEAFRVSNSYLIPEEAQMVTKNTPFSVYSDSGDNGKNDDDAWRSLDALLVPIRSKDSILGVISVDAPKDSKRPGVDRIHDLEIFADKAALAIENARYSKARKENERQAKFLAEISQIFHSSLKMEEVLEAIVQKGRAIAEFCSLLLVESETGVLKPQASYHANPQVVDRFLKGIEEFPFSVGDEIVGPVVATGKPFLAAKPMPEKLGNFKNTAFAYISQYHPIASIMVIPLKVHTRLIGVLVYLLCESERSFRSEDLHLATQLAERAAIAIENARLFKAAGEKAKELEKANQLKSEFLASVSHELRTPLNAIITLSDILIRGMSGSLNSDQTKQLEIIQRSGKNLLNLINDILDLSKVESQKVKPIYSEIPVRGIVEETIEHIRPLCNQKGLSLDLEFSENVPDTIYSDQDKITRALSNVLSNAVKFTRKGKISVKVELSDWSELKIAVKDTGIGIPEDRIDEIFKEFLQIDHSDSRAYGGTGLGLAITRKMLNVIGGSISVKSRLGKGSTFIISVPFGLKSEVKKDKEVDIDRKITPPQISDDTHTLTDDRDKIDENKKLVLVIDDDKEANYVMAQYLHGKNYQFLCPRNGEDIIDLAKQFRPFAITLDLIMPDQDGWEILQILKNEPEIGNIPVIITSILNEKERAFAIGADEYLVKPFDSEQLTALLAALDASKKKSVISDLGRFLASKRDDIFRRPKRPVSGAGRRILLVDDDQDTRYVLKYILEEAGYSLYFASEGWEAVKQAESVRPNLILMDIMMPGMNGYEATRNLKAKDEFKQVPIVAMTAKAMKGDREKTILAGCDDYIAKPFVTDDILTMVDKWLKISKSN